jgi:hypothetical protein
MKLRLPILFIVMLVPVPLAAKSISVRDHYLVAERNRHRVYEVTRIHDQADSSAVRTFLIADAEGPLLRIDVGTNYATNTAWTAYRLQRGSHAVATISELLPFTTTTPEGHRDEAMRHPELRDAPVPITVEGPGGEKLKGLHNEWSSAALAEARRNEAKRVLGKELAAALDAIRELAGLPMFADLNVAFQYLFEDAQIVRRSMKLMVALEKPNCDFDAKFSVPCAK